jgi:hypothetical protein
MYDNCCVNVELAALLSVEVIVIVAVAEFVKLIVPKLT